MPDAAPSNTDASGDGSGGTADAVSGAWLTPPAVQPALEVPAGAMVKLHAHAIGVQIYTCTASGGGDAGALTYAWVLKAPDAKLYDESGAQIGTHGAGPSWTSSDGSVAQGVKVAGLDSPLPDAIQWLLLRVSSTTGTGVLSGVTYVQRLNTTAGKAPATGCDSTKVGTENQAAYTADYYFYTGGGSAAWLTPPAVPAAIALPAGAKVKLHYRGVGAQIYGCLANGGADAGADAGATAYSWVFKAPDALLLDMNFAPVGMHGAGPSWTSSDGSVVTAKAQANADAPRAGAIPWLLLKEDTTTGTGVFSDITFIQRLNTAGGKAPATGCDATTVNTQVRVPYSADYYFFVQGSTADAAASD
jgi:hypothetical protein